MEQACEAACQGPEARAALNNRSLAAANAGRTRGCAAFRLGLPRPTQLVVVSSADGAAAAWDGSSGGNFTEPVPVTYPTGAALSGRFRSTYLPNLLPPCQTPLDCRPTHLPVETRRLIDSTSGELAAATSADAAPVTVKTEAEELEVEAESDAGTEVVVKTEEAEELELEAEPEVRVKVEGERSRDRGGGGGGSGGGGEDGEVIR